MKRAGAAARALAAPGLRAAAPRLAAVALAAGPAGLRPVAVTWDQREPFRDSPSPAQSALTVRAGRTRAARAALVGGLLLTPLLDGALVGLLFAFLAGIMIYVSLEELLPAAREHATDHTVTLSALLGVALMLATLAVLRA